MLHHEEGLSDESDLIFHAIKQMPRRISPTGIML
jgi:hypothetical protein|tara:strand:- start:3580 stop:3681 length:102 start_codon:yes stop_codon:yes gene_type:complete